MKTSNLRGQVRILLSVLGVPTPAFLRNVLFTPFFNRNFFSVTAASKGKNIIFTENTCTIKTQTGITAATASRVGRLFILDQMKPPETACLAADQALLWHQRMGHVSFSSLPSLDNASVGMKLKSKTVKKIFCPSCAESKAHKLPFPKSTSTRATKIADRQHSDVCSMTTKTPSGRKAFVSCIDDFSRFADIRLITKKSEVPGYLKARIISKPRLAIESRSSAATMEANLSTKI